MTFDLSHVNLIINKDFLIQNIQISIYELLFKTRVKS